MKKDKRKPKLETPKLPIYTLGHSNRTLDKFLEILRAYQIDTVIDVRRYPSSLKFQHFNSGVIKQALKPLGLLYFWFGDYLGGFRPEGYENFMQTDLFAEGIQKLTEMARRSTTVVMCAEKNYAHCHRWFIANHLTDAGFRVLHIQDREHLIGHLIAQKKLSETGTSSQMDLFT